MSDPYWIDSAAPLFIRQPPILGEFPRISSNAMVRLRSQSTHSSRQHWLSSILLAEILSSSPVCPSSSLHRHYLGFTPTSRLGRCYRRLSSCLLSPACQLTMTKIVKSLERMKPTLGLRGPAHNHPLGSVVISLKATLLPFVRPVWIGWALSDPNCNLEKPNCVLIQYFCHTSKNRDVQDFYIVWDSERASY